MHIKILASGRQQVVVQQRATASHCPQIIHFNHKVMHYTNYKSRN